MSYVQLLLVIRNVVLSKNLQFMLGVINTRVSISPHKHFFVFSCHYCLALSGRGNVSALDLFNRMKYSIFSHGELMSNTGLG